MMTPSNRALWKPLWAWAIGLLHQLNGCQNRVGCLLGSQPLRVRRPSGVALVLDGLPLWESPHSLQGRSCLKWKEFAAAFWLAERHPYAPSPFYRLRISPVIPARSTL